MVTGGVAENPVNIPGSTSGSPRLSGSILQVNGILYISSPDNAWAMDALDGHILWHYWWKSRGGTHIGNRGMAMYGDWLFFETPDDYLVSLDAKTGQERWHREIADFNQQYFSTTAPVVVGDHVLVGTGDDLDAPGFLQSFDPKTGDLQWKFYTVPMKQGDPGLDTWASLDAAQHGGAQVWIPGSYDAETHLYIFGTGNPTPAYTARVRGPRDAHTNLYTCSVIAVNVETGKLAWYFQTSPNDTHDWDSTQPPVLVDELVSAELRCPDGTLLCRFARVVLDVLSDVDGPAHDDGAGRQRAGCSWITRNLYRRDRLPHGNARLEVSLRGIGGRIRRCHRFAHDRRRSAVRQRRGWRSGRLWPAGDEAAGAPLARPHRLHRERCRNLHRGRTPICARDGRGGSVRILPAIVRQ